MNEKQKRALVLELLAQDAQLGLNASVAEKREELIAVIENLWDKYRVTLTDLRSVRATVEGKLTKVFKALSYS
jgi:type I restriction enzyme M protein